MTRTRQSLLLLALLMTAVFSTGCNTVEGAGKDIQGAGEKIEDAADDAKN